jgi:molybdate transport system substrate-binding protein
MRSRVAALLSLPVLFAAGACRSPGPTPVRIAAASDLASAFADLGPAFEARSGRPVAVTFGSSGLLARQLREGAPFDLFAAADGRFVDDAIASGACDPATRATYGRGRLAIWSRSGGVRPAAALADLADPRFVRIALANPEHAPYGLAAREALEAAGLWNALRPRLVFGENARGALQLAQSGNAEAALIPRSLAAGGAWVEVDPSLYRAPEHVLAVCRHGADPGGGRAFAAFLLSPEGLALLGRHGLEAPPLPANAGRDVAPEEAAGAARASGRTGAP